MKEVILAWSFFQYHLSSVWIRSENDFSGAGATWYSNMSTVTQTYVSEKRLTLRPALYGRIKTRRIEFDFPAS